jgi:putative acetyltransferase
MISIRPERPEDIAAIRSVNEAAFEQTTEADIVDALRNACPNFLSLVAESDGEIVGHILFSPVINEDGAKSVQGMGLAPMAVLPERQR